MKLFVLYALIALMLFGCARKPMVIEYYPPETKQESDDGHGAIKSIDYRKPQGVVTLFGFSIM